jgi:hypothetical protein
MPWCAPCRVIPVATERCALGATLHVQVYACSNTTHWLPVKAARHQLPMLLPGCQAVPEHLCPTVQKLFNNAATFEMLLSPFSAAATAHCLLLSKACV